MKTTRILMVTFLMSIFCVTLSYAQQSQKVQQGQKPKQTAQQGQKPKQTPEEKVAKDLETMKKSLNLTDDQVVKVRESQKQLSEDIKQIQAKNAGKGKTAANREEMNANREEMKVKTDAYNARLKMILTPEQYQKYQDQNQNKNVSKKGQKNPTGDSQQLKGQDKKQITPNKKPNIQNKKQNTKEAAK